ncbi:MAG: enoyl-CoA hydratase/isomerase family protein [Alphaproteobacteria bacterium]|nr:enoyl-CoA hydratase/isomerase family protein [Alphaproteobacteria bacterium]
MTGPLKTSVIDGVMNVTLNTPDDHNRMDRRMMAAIVEAMEAADADTSVRVIVLTGAGEFFCAGGRVDGWPKGTLKQRTDYAQAFCSMQERMGRTAAPIIAAVTGHCTAGGMSLLSFCDLAVASDDVEFGYPEAKKGQFPALALAMLVPMMPSKRAFDLLYTGERFTAAEALNLMLVNKVVKRAQVVDEVERYVAAIKRLNPTAVGLGRKAFYAMVPMSPPQRLSYAQSFLTTMLLAEEAEAATKTR